MAGPQARPEQWISIISAVYAILVICFTLYIIFVRVPLTARVADLTWPERWFVTPGAAISAIPICVFTGCYGLHETWLENLTWAIANILLYMGTPRLLIALLRRFA